MRRSRRHPELWTIITVVTVLQGCQSRFEQRDQWIYCINNGEGTEKPLLSSRDYYELLLGTLHDKDVRIRVSTADLMGTFTLLSGRRYNFVLDAYIDGGRGEQLCEALRAARERAARRTEERMTMLKTLAEAKMRRYLWEHPDLAPKMTAFDLDPPLRGFGPFRFSFAMPLKNPLAQRMISEGDEEMEELWVDLADHRAAARRGELKPLDTDDWYWNSKMRAQGPPP